MSHVTERAKVYPPDSLERELSVACEAAVQGGAAAMQFYGDKATVSTRW